MRIKYIINALPIVNKRTQRWTQVDARELRGLSERSGLLELVLELNDRFLKLISYLLGICDRPLSTHKRHWSQISEWQVSQAKLTVDYSEPRLALSARSSH